MFHMDRNAEDSPFCHTSRWENAFVPLHLFWVSSNSLRLSITTSPLKSCSHKTIRLYWCSPCTHEQKRKQRHLPRRCLSSSRLSCLPPALVAAPITIPLFMMTKRFWFYDLLLPGSLQHHLFPSPHETISAVFLLLSFPFWCSGFFSTLWHFYQLAVLYKQLIRSLFVGQQFFTVFLKKVSNIKALSSCVKK